MRFGHYSNRWTDGDGKDVGGVSHGVGFSICWQNGPLVEDKNKKDAKVANGAIVEDVIEACKLRLVAIQRGSGACLENDGAIKALDNVLSILDSREFVKTSPESIVADSDVGLTEPPTKL